MAIEIIPKPKTKEISWLNLILYFLLLIFFILFLSYFILGIYQQKLNKKIAELEQGLVRTPSEEKLEKEIFDYQRKIADFGLLLEDHPFPLNIFNFLEKNTHPKVWFSKLDLDLEKNLLKISGQADSFEIVAQQLFIFKKAPLIKELNLSNFSKGKEGKIEFEFQLTFSPQIFK